METPIAGLALGFASGSALAAAGDARRSPFSTNNTITTDWKSDPAKTSDLLRDITKVLQSPVPSPARRLEGDFQAEPNRLGPEQSAKELVASLEKLLQKSTSMDSDGQAALRTLRTSLPAPSPLATAGSLPVSAAFPSPQPSSPLAVARSLTAAGHLLGSQPSSPLVTATSLPAAATAPFSSPMPAGAPASGGESPRPSLGRRGSRWQCLTSHAASVSPLSGASPTSFGSPPPPIASPAAGSAAALLEQISSVASPPSASAARRSAASPPSHPVTAAVVAAALPYTSSSISAAPPSSPPGGAGSSPTLSRWYSLARRASVKFDDTRSLLAGATQAAASPYSVPQIESIVLRPVQLDLRPRQGLRFEQEAAKVLAELAAFAELESSTNTRFRAAFEDDMRQLFRLPAS